MDKKFPSIFLAASGAFFVFIVGLTGYRIEDARQRNTAAARERMTTLEKSAVSLRDATGGLTTPQFKKGMRALFDAEPRLLLLSIHSDEGILYLVTRSKAYLRDPVELTPDWRGTPSYVVGKGYEILLSAPLAPGTGTAGTATLDTLSAVLGRDDLYPVVRDDVYLFLAFLLVCGVLMLIVFGVQQDPIPGRAPPAAGPAPVAAPGTRSPETPPVAAPVQAAAVQAAGPARVADGERSLTSSRTGLVLAEHLAARLEAELEGAAGGDQDLACARITVDGPFLQGNLPVVYAEIARALREAFPVPDLLFESGDDSYSVVLPDTGVDAAVGLLEDFRAKVSSAPIEGRKRTLSVGVSSRGGRLIEHTTLFEEAGTALAKAMREGGNQVIGFRADAARFREILSGSVR